MANPTREIVSTLRYRDQLPSAGTSPVIPITNPQPVSGEEELLAGVRKAIAMAIQEQPSTPTLADHGLGGIEQK